MHPAGLDRVVDPARTEPVPTAAGPVRTCKSRILPQNDDRSEHASVGGRGNGRAYNPCMLHTFAQLIGTALMQRFTLLVNHVIAAEPVAKQKLSPHAGRCIRFHPIHWPAVLPALPELAFVITPAGLVEWCEGIPAPTADLEVTIDASNPARTLAQGLAGQRPPVEVSGDAALATDVSWLMDNLRWDVQDDLARLIGDGPAHELARIGATLSAGLREAVGTLAGLVARVAGGPQDPSARKPESPAR